MTATRKESLRVQTSGSRSETSSDVMKELQREGAWGDDDDDVCDQVARVSVGLLVGDLGIGWGLRPRDV